MKHPRAKVDSYHFCPTTGEQIRYLRTMTPGGRLIVKKDPWFYRAGLWIVNNVNPISSFLLGCLLGAVLLWIVRQL